MRDITKRFGSVVANDRVWLDIYRGEILALLGENGSGKTTLMNMLSGIYFPDEGQVLIDGEEVVIRSPRDAYRYGIGMIHQHFKLVDVFTAAENITLGLDEKLDLKATAARIRSWLSRPSHSSCCLSSIRTAFTSFSALPRLRRLLSGSRGCIRWQRRNT